MLSIDFGTTRTKVAYYDASRGRVSLANMGGDNAAFPSLFYVGTDGQVFCGSEAMDFLDSDPGGTIRRAKSRLRDRAIRVNGRTLRPVDLVTKLFASLRKRAGEEVPAFGGKAPVSVVLTLPAAGAGSGPVVEQIMRDAASAAGFTEVWLLTEPEGAAMAWQHEEGGGADDVVVILDGGGGTVDWACLKRVDGTLRLFADCPPGGDDKVGGEYLDEDLFGILTSKLEAREANDALTTVQSQSNKWFLRIRGLRERFNRTGKVGTQDAMRVAGEVVSLEDAEVQGAIQDRFVNQVCAGFGRYLDGVRRATGVANPRVLLVGGTGQVSGLKEALREKCRCEPTWWQLSEFAPVIGATWWGAERAGMLVGRAGGDNVERTVAEKVVPAIAASGPDDQVVSNPRPPNHVLGDVLVKPVVEAGDGALRNTNGDGRRGGKGAAPPAAEAAVGNARERAEENERKGRKAPSQPNHPEGRAITPASAHAPPVAVGGSSRSFRVALIVAGVLLVLIVVGGGGLGLLAAASLAQSGAAGPTASQAKEIVVGEYGALTGAQAAFGLSTKNGIELATDGVNAKGGIGGVKVRVVVEDDVGTPEGAATAVGRLISQARPVAVIGEVASTNSIAAAPLLQAAGIPMVSPGSTNPRVTEEGDFIFRACFIDPVQGDAVAKFAYTSKGLRSVGILKDIKSDYAMGLTSNFRETFRSLGGTIGDEEAYSQGDVDFKVQLSAMIARHPDAIFIPGYYTDVGLIARQARDLGFEGPFLGGDGWDSAELTKIGGDAVLGSFFTNHYAVDDPNPVARDFVAAYRARYHEEPDGLAALGYDSAMVLYAAMAEVARDPKVADAMSDRSSVADTEANRKAARAAIRDQLARTAAFSGVTGQITIDAERNAQKPVVVVEVGADGNKFVESVPPDGTPLARTKSQPTEAKRSPSVTVPATSAAPATPNTAQVYPVEFRTSGCGAAGCEGEVRCGDGQVAGFVGSTSLNFAGTVTCLVSIGGHGCGAVQVSRQTTVTCSEDAGKVTCNDGGGGTAAATPAVPKSDKGTVSFSFTSSPAPLQVEVRCSDGFAGRASLGRGVASVANVPTGADCKMYPKGGVTATAYPVKAGSHYSCSITGVTTDCR